ncbi:MAG: histidine-type phosphatase [Proteobacteria bacterium]|nr:histidine-type phosphatase [Pseudomonadota bacterium]
MPAPSRPPANGRLRRWSTAILVAGILAGCVHPVLPATDAHESKDDTLRLERVVMLMRHGIRPPTKLPPIEERFTRQPWPDWEVPAGHLTARGFDGAILMGRWSRRAFFARGLLPATGCPEPGAVSVRANTDQRTRETARGFLQGFAYLCDIDVAHSAGHRDDPMFQSIDLGLVAHDRDAARAAVLQRLDGRLGNATRPVADALARLDAILDCCQGPACAPPGTPASCRLSDMPTAWAETAPSKRIKFTGPLDAGGTAAHTLLLEYVEGKPPRQVGWGRATEADIERLSGIHAREFDLLHRTPYIATRGATPILEHVLAAFSGDTGAKVSLLVGHDTNVANVGGALDLHWHVPGYAPDDAAVGGAIGFELLRSHAGQRFVRAFYQAQGTRQLRGLQALGAGNPPYFVHMPQPLCGLPEDRSLCRYEDFVAALRTRIVR